MPTIHNPTNFIPEDYEVVDYLDAKRPVMGFGEDPEWFRAVLAEWNASFAHYFGWASTGRANVPHHCEHCGHFLRYVCVAHHAPTNTFVCIGQDCAKRVEMSIDQFKVNVLIKAAKARAETIRLGSKYQRFLNENPEVAQAFELNKLHRDEHDWYNEFVFNVQDRAERYASLSDKQIEAVVAAVARDAERIAERARQRAEDAANASPVPVTDDRVEITGTVVSKKWQANQFSYYGEETLKVLIRDDRGFKLWGTAPRAVEDSVERGSRISFVARIERSDNDETFGFFKRPTKVQLLEEEVA